MIETDFLIVVLVAMLAVFGVDAADKRRKYLGSE